MQRIFKLISILLFSPLICCTNHHDDAIEPKLTENLISSYNAKEIIASFGYDTTIFEDKEDYYLVDKTYRFYKKDLPCINDSYSKLKYTRSASEQTIPPHYRHISISLSDYSIASLFENAACMWNNVNSDIQFEISNYDANPDFPVKISILLEASTDPSQDFIELTPHSKIPQLYSVNVNTNHSLWSSLQYEDKLDHLAMFILGRIIGIEEISTLGYNDTIMYSPSLAALNPGIVWCNGLSIFDSGYLTQKYPLTKISNYSINFSPALFGTDEHFVITGQPYTITIKNNTECCKNINVTRSFVVTDTHGEDITNNVLTYDTTDENKVTIIFPENGTYTFYFSVIDNNLDYISPIHTEAISVTARGRRFEWDAVSSVQLGTTYKIRYIPDIPDQQTRVGNYQIAYYLRETMFSNGNIIANSEQRSQFADLSVNNDECSVVLFKTGCYYLEAVTTLDGVTLNTDYCNITKLPRLPQEAELRLLNAYNESMVSGLENNEDTLPKKDSLFYALRFPNANSTGSSNNRVGYLVEYEYEEMHSDMHPRRLDRQWHLDYHTIEHTSLKISKTLPPLYYRYGSTYDWRKEHYTGHIYCPTDGIRETETMSLLELPMQRVIAQGYENIILVSENDRKIIVEE